ncbi:MAG: cell division protein ZapA [Paracoccaceae bacterium]|jgi:cell division protein ZapA|nr:cell division protein ZapA [Pseudomonadota bacterium]MDA0851087.1 cell division protein ZapA [Pseudomonadota bacterium]MDA1294498.1 cell division protein ZapA [Pseudomonadota bacterium]NCW14292.1 cell division protein ZapA [Paracoccaceae bacterium]
MPEVEIEIGGRRFEVACQPGEEDYLISAATALDKEASSIGDQLGRLSEARMLLMAGLMLADQAGNLKEKLAKSDADLSAAISEVSRLNAELSSSSIPGNENAALSAEFEKTLTDIAEKAERLADKIDSQQS